MKERIIVLRCAAKGEEVRIEADGSGNVLCFQNRLQAKVHAFATRKREKERAGSWTDRLFVATLEEV